MEQCTRRQLLQRGGAGALMLTAGGLLRATPAGASASEPIGDAAVVDALLEAVLSEPTPMEYDLARQQIGFALRSDTVTLRDSYRAMVTAATGPPGAQAFQGLSVAERRDRLQAQMARRDRLDGTPALVSDATAILVDHLTSLRSSSSGSVLPTARVEAA